MAAWRWAFVVDGIITSELIRKSRLRDLSLTNDISRDWPIRSYFLSRYTREDHGILLVSGRASEMRRSAGRRRPRTGRQLLLGYFQTYPVVLAVLHLDSTLDVSNLLEGS